MDPLETLFNNVLSWWWSENATCSGPTHNTYSHRTFLMFGSEALPLAFEELKRDRFSFLILDFLKKRCTWQPTIPASKNSDLKYVKKAWLKLKDTKPIKEYKTDIMGIVRGLNARAEVMKASTKLQDILNYPVSPGYAFSGDPEKFNTYHLVIYTRGRDKLHVPIPVFKGYRVQISS